MGNKITVEITLDSLATSTHIYVDELSDKLQQEILKTVRKKVRRWNFWSTVKIKLLNIISKVEEY